MHAMFYMVNVSNLNLSNFDTSKVVDMQWMFAHSKLNTLDVSNFNINNVTKMTELFALSSAQIIYVKDQISLDRFVNEGSAIASRLVIK